MFLKVCSMSSQNYDGIVQRSSRSSLKEWICIACKSTSSGICSSAAAKELVISSFVTFCDCLLPVKLLTKLCHIRGIIRLQEMGTKGNKWEQHVQHCSALWLTLSRNPLLHSFDMLQTPSKAHGELLTGHAVL